MPKPLEEYTIDELIEEIEKRYDEIVFGAFLEATKDITKSKTYWNGESYRCKGLAFQIIEDIGADIRKNSEKDY